MVDCASWYGLGVVARIVVIRLLPCRCDLSAWCRGQKRQKFLDGSYGLLVPLTADGLATKSRTM
jgi:hypothetical protein